MFYLTEKKCITHYVFFVIKGHVRVCVRWMGVERTHAGEPEQLGHHRGDGRQGHQGPDQDSRHVQPPAQPGTDTKTRDQTRKVAMFSHYPSQVQTKIPGARPG